MSAAVTVTEGENLLNGNQQQHEIVNSQSKTKKSIKARTVLWHVVFWGFVVNYMVRCNINMAIVSMVIPRVTTNRTEVKVSECFNHSSVSSPQNTSFSQSGESHNGFRIERNIMDLLHVIFIHQNNMTSKLSLRILNHRQTTIKTDLNGMNISRA